MSANSRTPESNPLKHEGSIEEEDDVVWKIIKAIQNARSGQTQIIIRESSVVELRAAQEVGSA